MESDDISKSSTDIVNSLLDEFSKNRTELVGDLDEVKKMKVYLQSLFPSEINFKNKFIMEEKMKVMSNFLSSMLNIRQEINKSIIQEIAMRQKLNPETKNNELTIDQLKNIIKSVENKLGTDSNGVYFSSDIDVKPTELPEEDEISKLSEKEK